MVDRDGEPVRGAVAALHEAPEIRFLSDVGGRIVVRASGLLVVSASGYATDVCEPETRRIVLDPGFVVGGRVVDSAGNPLAGVSVTISQGGGCHSHPFHPRATTDAGGRFLATALQSGDVTVESRLDGFAAAYVNGTSGEMRLEVTLFRAASIRVRVLLPDGEPAVDACCGCGNCELMATDDDDGSVFSDRMLEPGAHELKAHTKQLAVNRTVSLAEGEHRDVTLVLAPKPAPPVSYIKVRVLDWRGHPLEGARVAKTYTNSHGLAEVAKNGAPGEEHRVRILPSKRNPHCLGTKQYVTTVVRDGTPVDVQLRRSAELAVEVVDVWGRPVEAEVDAWVGDGRRIGPRLWIVDPTKTVTVEVNPRDPVLSERTVVGLKHGRQRIVVYPWTRITGRVIDEAGRPCGDVRVSRNEWGWSWDDEADETGADGRFCLEGAETGTNKLVIGRGDIPGAVLSVRVRKGRPLDVGDVVCRAPRRIRGRVLDRFGHPLGGAYVAARPYFSGASQFTTSHADGTFSMHVAAMVRYLEIAKYGHGGRSVPLDGTFEIALPAPGRFTVKGARDYRVGWPQSGDVVLWEDVGHG